MFEQFMTMTEAEIRAEIAKAYADAAPMEDGRTIDECLDGWIKYVAGMNPQATDQQVMAEAAAILMSFTETE